MVFKTKFVFPKINTTGSWDSESTDKKEVDHSPRYIVNIKKSTFNVGIDYVKWISLIVVQFGILVYVFTIILGETNIQMQFKVTPQQMEAYKTVQTYRKQLIVQKPVKNDVWSATIPVTQIYLNGKPYATLQISVKAEFIGPYLKNQNNRMDGYNGPLTLNFDPYATSEVYISDNKNYLEKIDDITNVVELGPEFYTCFTFEVHTNNAIYNVEITDGCMFIKSLMHRWATNSRLFPADFPEKIPEGAKEANHFAITFHREQPCHFSVEYMKDLDIIYSVPVKTITYKPSHAAPGDTSRTYVNIIGELFDGIHFDTLNKNSYKIDQMLKYYQETNKLYPLKTKIVVDHETRDIDGSKIDNDMWLDGANFKYDVTSKNCYMIDANSKLLLEKNSVKFVVDGDTIKIHVVNKNSIFDKNNVQIFAAEKYGVLIENDAKKCGILDVKQN